MSLIDTHAHLDIPPLNQNTDDIIKRAKDSGIHKIITIAVDIDSSFESIKYALKYDMVYASCGIHPNHAKNIAFHDLERLKSLANEKKIVAIGEVGLDYHWDYCPAEKQKEIFLSQIDIARETNLPLIIHSREANEDVYEILKGYANGMKGVFHCFSGDVVFAKKILDLGFYISFTGVITFPKAITLKEVAAFVPSDRIMLETDCPYLAPVPTRGKTNEPSYLKYIAEEIAKIKGISLEELAHCTTRNATEFFSL